MSLNKEQVFSTPKEILRPNEIPSVMVVGNSLPEVWENEFLAVEEFGCRAPTQYDSEEDPHAKMVSMAIVVGNPFAEPRIHKFLPEGIDGLWLYTAEVVAGLHSDRVEGWNYSYFDRMANWPGKTEKEAVHFDQIDKMVENLANVFYTRRAQMITWYPPSDSSSPEPPCFQRAWGQIVSSDDDKLFLEFNTHWRSRDVFKAAFMNMFAFTWLQKMMAEMISEKAGVEVGVGRYAEFVDNMHIYGSYERRKEVEGFIKSLEKKDFSQRVYRTDDPIIKDLYYEAREKMLKESGTAQSPEMLKRFIDLVDKFYKDKNS